MKQKTLFRSTLGFCFWAFTALPALPDSPGPQWIDADTQKVIRVGMETAGVAPVRPPATTSTEEDHWRRWRVWVRRVLIAPMKTQTASKPWGAGAADFVEKALDARFTPRWVEDKSATLVPAAKSLIAAGMDDPVALWLASEIMKSAGGIWAEVREVEAKARESFRKSSYPKVLGAILYQEKANHVDPSKPKSDEVASQLKCVEYLLESLKEDATWRDGDAPFYVTMLKNGILGDVCRQHPDKLEPIFHPVRFPDWAKETLAGMWEVEMGWKARGSGYADSVKGKDWEIFGDHLEKAAQHLRKACDLDPSQPFAAWRMINVAMAGGTKEPPRFWFDRCLAARIDYDPAWYSLLWSMRPRWGGSVESMVGLGLAAVECGRFDTQAPFFLIHALDDAQEELHSFDKSRDLYKQPGVADAMTAAFDGYFRYSQSQAEREHFAWWRALSGWLTGKLGWGEAALADTGRRPPPDFVRYRLSRFQADEISLRGEMALSRTGALRKWEDLQQAWTDFDLPGAEKLLASLSASPAPAAKPLLKRMQTLVDMERQLRKGEWIKLSADPELSCWQWINGRWSGDANGNLVLTGEESEALITHRIKVGAAFEAKGSILCPVKTKTDFQAGLAIQHLATPRSFGNWVSASLGFFNNKYMASIDSNFFRTKIPFKPVTVDTAKPIPWTVRLKDGRLTWTVNGTTLYENESLERDNRLNGAYSPAPNGRFGFGLRRSPPHTTVLFSPVELRRLK